MAKKHTWKPRPADAIALATIRWYAVTIEKLAIEAYVTNRGKFEELDDLLRQQLKALCRVAAQRSQNVKGSEDCPDGWFLCKDGFCAPACDSDLALQMAKARNG
jgi:hypothetical protein